MAAKAITTTFFTRNILMMDMSRAFDTMKRGCVIEDLRSILTPSELHIIKLRIEDVILIVDVTGHRGEPFITNTETPQGDTRGDLFSLCPIWPNSYITKKVKQVYS